MKIDPLSKVTLSVTAESPAEQPLNAETTLTFIYGIGSAGLSEFECALNRNPEDRELRVSLKPSDAAAFFGHLGGLVRDWLPQKDEICLTFGYLSSEPASSREVVTAMAKGTECGCGCGDGCQC